MQRKRFDIRQVEAKRRHRHGETQRKSAATQGRRRRGAMAFVVWSFSLSCPLTCQGCAMNGRGTRGTRQMLRSSVGPLFSRPTCSPRCCTTCMSRGVAREQMRVYAPNRILGGWPSPATVHSPHRCGAAATCQRQRQHQPSRAPQKTSPSAGPRLRSRQSSIPIPNSTTVTLTPPETDRPSSHTPAPSICASIDCHIRKARNAVASGLFSAP